MISLCVIMPGLISLIFFGLKLGHRLHRRHVVGTPIPQAAQPPSRSEAVRGAGVYRSRRAAIGGQRAIRRYFIRMQGVPRRLAGKEAARERPSTAQIGPFTELEFSSSRRRRSATRFATVPSSRWSSPRSASCSTSPTPSATRRIPLLYGVCAIVAMLHDVFVVLGIFSILG